MGNIPLKGGTYVQSRDGYALLPRSIHPNRIIYGDVEIALKGVIYAIGIEPPKVHNKIKTVERSVKNSNKISPDKRNELREISRSLLPELLENRQVGGYTFNYNIDEESLEIIALKYLESSQKAVFLCKEIVKQIATKK